MNKVSWARRRAVVVLAAGVLATGLPWPRVAHASGVPSSTDLVLWWDPGATPQVSPDEGNVVIQERVVGEDGARPKATAGRDAPSDAEGMHADGLSLAQTGDAFREVAGAVGAVALLGGALAAVGLAVRRRRDPASHRPSKVALAVLGVACPLALAWGMAPGATCAYADDTSPAGSLSRAGEAYAVLTDTGELVFFRSEDAYTNRATGTFTDVAGNEYAGQVFAAFETTNATSASSVRWYSRRTAITSVRVAEGQAIAPTSTANWFNGCTRLSSCDLSLLDTSRLATTERMFSGCTNAALSPDVSTWDTSALTSTAFMFSNCSGAAFNPDVSAWDVSHVNTFSSMFYGCSGRSFNPDVSSWDTSSASVMYNMFFGCSGASFNPDVSAWDMSHATNISQLFHTCSGAAFNPDVSAWDISRVTNMTGIFNSCSGPLFDPDVSSWDTSRVTSLYGVFANCTGEALSPDVSAWDTSQVTNMQSTFLGCRRLETLDLSGWDTSRVTTMQTMFADCVSLKSVTLGERFSFLGAGIASEELQGVLPTPPGSQPYTGSWINATAAGASAVSAEELRDGYDGTLAEGSYARGRYVWEESSEAGLTLDLAGGTAREPYPTSYEPGSALLLPGTEGSAFEAPTRYGYDFLGWADEEGSLVAQIDATSTGERTLTARWVASNMGFSVPASLTFAVASDGRLAGPGSAYVENEGPWPIRVAAPVVEPEAGWAVVEDAAASAEPNVVDLTLSIQGEQIRAADCLEAPAAVQAGEWTLAPASGGEGSRLPFELSGHAASLTADVHTPQRFATLHWHVELAPEREP